MLHDFRHEVCQVLIILRFDDQAYEYEFQEIIILRFDDKVSELLWSDREILQ